MTRPPSLRRCWRLGVALGSPSPVSSSPRVRQGGARRRRPGAGCRPGETAVATFAGGCFWCMEPPYDKLDGVISTTSGYMGGTTRNPTYQEVSSGVTGHAEVVQVVYDPAKVSYEKLLDVFWDNVDPTVKDRPVLRHGHAVPLAIFVHNEAQLKAAEASKAALAKSKPFKEPIVTPIVPAASSGRPRTTTRTTT